MNESKHANKSLRHMTREALPRLDNYRNILSIHVGHRPTLDELHNNTIHEKVCETTLLISYLCESSLKNLTGVIKPIQLFAVKGRSKN